MDLTYELVTVAGRPAIRCLLCGAVSPHVGDLANRYCARCHLFHDAVADGRRHVSLRGAHDCAEWWTARRCCALCGAPEAGPHGL